jgi:tetratricopeptide (TPR) repeat protein
MIGLLIEDIPVEDLPAELTETWQLVNLASGNDHEVSKVTHPITGEEQHVHFSVSGLTRLKAGLVKAGLDPLFYEWPPMQDLSRAPYRGMAPLESVDAGIFFGRAAPTNELLSKLREMRSKPSPGFMVILGASGAGKSSFLRAGILPRLSRDERHFLTLPIIRPEHSVLWGENGLLSALDNIAKELQLKMTRASIRKSIESSISHSAQDANTKIADIVNLLNNICEHASVKDLEQAGKSTKPTLVITVDQGEELFHSEGVQESTQFLDLLTLLATQTDLSLMVLFTIRSDSFELLQTYKAFEGVTQQTFSLSPMPQGAYHRVIEGPASRLKGSNRELKVEAALTQQLSEDIEKGGNRDALPLLAFTMERLYLEYASSGELNLAQYREMGGIEGAIEAAVELALISAQKDPALPNKRESLIALLHRGLIPWLAGIDPQSQTPRRRVANLSEIPLEARPMIEHLIAQRLLLTDVDKVTNETTIEPAHEALLRQWGLLKGWLKEDFAALTTIESIQRASRDWQANNKDTDWLSHNSGRLQDAEDIKRRDDLAQFLKPKDWEYLNQCRSAENNIRNKELDEARKLVEVQQREANAHKKVAKRTTMGMAVALGLLMISAFFGWQTLQEQRKAVEQKEVAERERTRAQIEAEKAQAVSHFMQTTFEAANPLIGGRKDIQLIEALDESISLIEKSFANQPVIEAVVKNTVGRIYLAMQELEKASPLIKEALDLRIENLQAKHPDISESYLSLGELQQEEGLYAEAKESITKALSLTTERVGETSLEIAPILDELVQSHIYLGELETAKVVADRTLKMRRDLNSPDVDIAFSLLNRAKVDTWAGNWALAKPFAQDALALKRSIGDTQVSIMHSLNSVGNIALGLGDLEDAEIYFSEAIEISTSLFGEKHGNTALYKENLGNIMFQQKRYDETLKLLGDVLEIRVATYGKEHDMVARTNANMGAIYMAIGKHEQAQGHLETAFAIFESVLPPNHPNLAHLLTSLARNETSLGQYQEAMVRLNQTREIQVVTHEENSWQVGRVELQIGKTLLASGQTLAAKTQLSEALEKLSLHEDPNYRDLISAKELLAELETSQQ